MRDWLAERPWVWIVLFLVVVALANLALVVLSGVGAPEVLRGHGPAR